MISNSLSPQEEFLFSSPQSLEQLRQELLTLAHQDQHSSEYLHSDIESILAIGDSYSVPFPLDLLRQVDFQLKERSTCIMTLSQLAIKMVECIRDQQTQHIQLIERYEHEMEGLREQNDCLNSRNRHIETDVEYFREHLQAAEHQLQSISALQDGLEDDDEEEQLKKDRQIDELQREVERIRGELQFYKFSSASRRSIKHLPFSHQYTLQPIRSQDFLKIDQKYTFQNELQFLQQAVSRLTVQNEMLRRQINFRNNQSRVSFHLPTQIMQERIQQTQRTPIGILTMDHHHTPLASIPLFEKTHLLRDTSKSLESPRSHFQLQEIQLCQTPSMAQNLRTNVLSSEWSTKSFDHLQNSRHNKLIYLQEEEEEKHKHSTTRIQETKQTEESVREGESKKELVDMGVNTDTCNQTCIINKPLVQGIKGQNQLPQLHQNKKEYNKSPSSSLLDSICSFLIGRRIHRSIVRANQSLLLIY